MSRFFTSVLLSLLFLPIARATLWGPATIPEMADWSSLIVVGNAKPSAGSVEVEVSEILKGNVVGRIVVSPVGKTDHVVIKEVSSVRNSLRFKVRVMLRGESSSS